MNAASAVDDCLTCEARMGGSGIGASMFSIVETCCRLVRLAAPACRDMLMEQPILHVHAAPLFQHAPTARMAG